MTFIYYLTYSKVFVISKLNMEVSTIVFCEGLVLCCWLLLYLDLAWFGFKSHQVIN